MLQGILDWLISLPPALLYLALAGVAATENFFPPLPADTIVAFGAFLAARGAASPIAAFIATWAGNTAGALLMYYLGRRFGPARLSARFPALGGEAGAKRIAEMYRRYGIAAIFLSRFLPGARALVPPMAGMLRVPALSAALAIALASAIWYGAISVLAFKVGSRWEDLAAMVTSAGRWSAIGAAAIVALVVAIVWWRRRRKRQP